MKGIFLGAGLWVVHSLTFAQAVYTGSIDKLPIELVTDIYSDGPARAIYMYTEFDIPIVLNGNLDHGVLTLNEPDQNGTISALLTFHEFDGKSKKLLGIWKSLTTGKELPISLTKRYEIDIAQVKDGDREVLQSVSLKKIYFRIVVSIKDGFPRATSVKLYEKHTDELEQQFDLDSQLNGLDNVAVGDYNFDGFDDFSVFESSYSGPNSSRVYFLYNPRSRSFFRSEISGISLVFEPVSKTVTEVNQCCAGRQRTTIVYKVIDNKMVQVEEHCYIWDDRKKELVERAVSECR